MIQQNAITSLADIPPLLSAFAATLGFTVTGTLAAPIITHPTLVGALSFTFQATTTGSATTLRNVLRADAPGNYSAILSAPRQGVGFTSVAPTTVWLIGGTSPDLWLAIVVGFGFNRYRHLYFGTPHRLGNYTGGEIIFANYFNDVTGFNSQVPYLDQRSQFMFSGRTGNYKTADTRGAMRIVHPDNETERRVFSYSSSDATAGKPTDFIFGGLLDGDTPAHLARAKSDYSGANILIPSNLYISRAGDRYSPVGCPIGIRHVRMDDLEPEQTFSISPDDWIVFPEFAKGDFEYTTSGTQPPANETSHLAGLAYLTNG